MKLGFTVIPAQAGIQIAALVSRLRENDVTQKPRFDRAPGRVLANALPESLTNNA
ncbi:MAG: hypothetical protein WCK86_02800 [Planctomycetia bacterium]